MSIRLAAVLFALIGGRACAETVATPATFNDLLQKAKSGDTIRLAPGNYDRVSASYHHWSPPVTVEASAARLTSVRLDAISGLTWRGGNFWGNDVVPEGIKFEGADHVIVDSAAFHHYTLVGIIVGHVTDARLTNNVFTDAGSDGIDIAMSQRVVADHNRCTDFHPMPGAHPDCIQMWSKPGADPVADITITNNVAIGDMQGFTGFDGPYYRITVENNAATVTQYHGITLYECHDCVVRHNRVASLPNAKFPASRAWVLIKNGTDVIACDNRAKDYPDDAGRKQCRDGM